MFNVNQRVTFRDQIGKVTMTNHSGVYPIFVVFDNGGFETFTKDGRSMLGGSIELFDFTTVEAPVVEVPVRTPSIGVFEGIAKWLTKHRSGSDGYTVEDEHFFLNYYTDVQALYELYMSQEGK